MAPELSIQDENPMNPNFGRDGIQSDPIPNTDSNFIGDEPDSLDPGVLDEALKEGIVQGDLDDVDSEDDGDDMDVEDC